MPVYKYKAIDASGDSVQGIVDAESIKTANEKLKKEGVYLSSLKEVNRSKSRKFFPFGRVSIFELAISTRQFSTLISAGLPLEASLSALSEQAEDQKLKEVLTQVKDKVSEGSSLANALNEHPAVFPDLYINLVKAGEASGTLDIVLLRLADFLEKETALKSKVRSALIYPIFMFFIGMAVVLFMVSFVIPRISKIFEDSQKALPFITVVLIKSSNFITQHYFLILILFVAISLLIFRFKNTPRGKMFFDRMALKIPIFGKITSMVVISRFTRTLGTLIASGIPLLDALKISGAVIGNSVYLETIDSVSQNVREGSSLAKPLRDSEVFPPLVTRMIAVGEETGEMEKMLSKIADIYDQQVETTVSTLTSLLEPVMILGIGVVMGFIVFAILLPIFDLTSTIG